MSNTYVYSIEEGNPTTVYVNLTNKCTNHCVFCIRNSQNPIKGDNLWLESEDVNFDDVVSQFEKYNNVKEVVFCGYGEPTVKFELLKQVAQYLKEKNPEIKIRINTNGHGNLINKRNILLEIKNLVDEISVSLNAQNNETYMKISGCDNQKAYEEVKNFIKNSVKNGFKTTATVVTGYKDYSVDVKACENITTALGANFRERRWLEGY